jgi:sulfopyruvate decarboxylase beta subunit
MYEREVIEILKRNKIDVVATLPCEKISVLLRLVAREAAFCHVGLNREENGVGIAAGVCLAGGKPMMIIQSTGLGNSINAIMSLSCTYRLPLPIIASWRGVYEEKIEAQVPLGKALPKILDAMDLKYTVVADSSAIGKVEEVIQDAFRYERPHIALISPKAWGSGAVIEAGTVQHQKIARTGRLRYEKGTEEPEMRRYDAIRILSEYIREEPVISNIGVPSKELYALKDRALNFYMLGSLGQASPIGLGVALTTKRETIVLDGDGSLLMSNILPVVGAKKPENFSIVCLDNGTWGSTGDQPTPFYGDMELTAIGAGIENTAKVYTEAELRSSLERLYAEGGPRFLHVIVKPGNVPPVENIKLSAAQIKKRFLFSACL